MILCFFSLSSSPRRYAIIKFCLDRFEILTRFPAFREVGKIVNVEIGGVVVGDVETYLRPHVDKETYGFVSEKDVGEHGCRDVVHRVAVCVGIWVLPREIFIPSELRKIDFADDSEIFFFDVAYRCSDRYAGKVFFSHRWPEIDFRQGRATFDADRERTVLIVAPLCL